MTRAASAAPARAYGGTSSGAVNSDHTSAVSPEEEEAAAAPPPAPPAAPLPPRVPAVADDEDEDDAEQKRDNEDDWDDVSWPFRCSWAGRIFGVFAPKERCLLVVGRDC
jgi:hypothetical protein